jgi:hypothetical protein
LAPRPDIITLVTYDTNDAQMALQRLAATLSNGRDEQYAAGIRLLRELAQLRTPPGVRLQFTKDSECIEIEAGRIFRRIWLGGSDLTFKISEQQQEGTTRGLNAMVEYDPVSDMFVGTEDDSSIVPTPGAKRKKRDALTVVIDAIAEEMGSAGEQ